MHAYFAEDLAADLSAFEGVHDGIVLLAGIRREQDVGRDHAHQQVLDVLGLVNDL